MSIVALDVGDRWTGTALSDPLGITARPHQTVETKNLPAFLTELIASHQIKTILIGYPKTMKGTESDQTRKTKVYGESLEKQFSDINVVWWDERLTSKQAAHLKKQKNKADKRASHSIAAALLLMGYLEHLQFVT